MIESEANVYGNVPNHDCCVTCKPVGVFRGKEGASEEPQQSREGVFTSVPAWLTAGGGEEKKKSDGRDSFSGH